MKAQTLGRPYDREQLARDIRRGVADVVRKQVEIGLDVPSDGEYGRRGFTSYVNDRLGGIEPRELDAGESVWTGDLEDRRAFPAFFEQYDRHHRFLWMPPEVSIAELPNIPGSGQRFRVTGPITYTGQTAVQEELHTFKMALQGLQVADAFVTAIAPTGRKGDKGILEVYSTESAYWYALADALHEEYKAITDAGFIVQLDYAALNPEDQLLADRPNLTEEDLYQGRELGIEVLNHALRDILEEQVRYHHCWGSPNQPHTHDRPLRDIVHQMLKIKAQAYSIEAANPRHEHEWMVWRDVRLPDGKILIPGFISHQTNVVEHPELVAWRITNYAEVVGKENVIAGADCGFSQFWQTIRVHQTVQWAKLQALVDGAALASKSLWPR
jgi:5-methyltetrahydropteroyltriglutamate--homocysteine methyltransferase